MSDQEQSEQVDPQPPTVRAPPTVRGEVPKQPPIWPTVIGVISIIWACLGFLSAPFMIFMWWLMPEEFESPGAWVYVATLAVGVALSILVLMVGIRILQRRQSGVPLARIWSIISIVWTPIGIALPFVTESALDRADDPFELVGMISSGACGAVFALALPVFLLIWFSRAAIKAETAEWKP